MRRLSGAFVIGLFGLFFFLLGAGLAWFGARGLIRMWAWEKLTLKNSSEAMMKWTRPPQPTTFKVYLFNVTNPEEVSEGAYPNFREVGPYVYEEFFEKVNIIQLDNFTLSYQLKNLMKFNHILSGGLKESDLVTIINVPLAGAILTIYETVPEFAGVINDIWKHFYPGQKNIFITTRVRDILFDGITIDCTSKITEVYVACRALDSRKSASVRKEGKNFKFSFFYSKNRTSRETFQINQGILDLSKSSQYVGVNNSPYLNVWKNEYCDMVNGSDGAQFSVLLNKSQKLYIFEKELCRSVYVEFEKEITREGVTLYKFRNTRPLFASAIENPDNHCFCRSPMTLKDLVEEEDKSSVSSLKEDSKICFESGVLPLMPCIGAPIAVSFPHFYLGDGSYVNYSGLNPVKKLHETYIYVEPMSGMTVSGIKRIQFNIEIKRIFDVDIVSNLIDGLFPILWIEEGMRLSPDLFKLLRYNLIEKQVLEYGTYVLIGLGLFLIVLSYLTPKIFKKPHCCKSSDDFLKAQDLPVVKQHSDVGRPHFNFWQSSTATVGPSGFPRYNAARANNSQKTVDSFFY